MKIFTPQGLVHLGQCLSGFNAVHEHTAWPVEFTLKEDTDALKMLGHRVKAVVRDIAVFLQRGETRIELIQKGVPAHEAWLVRTKKEFDGLHSRFSMNPNFELVPGREIKLPHLVTAMFRHKDRGVVQIVWRQKQIYKGLFGKN